VFALAREIVFHKDVLATGSRHGVKQVSSELEPQAGSVVIDRSNTHTLTLTLTLTLTHTHSLSLSLSHIPTTIPEIQNQVSKESHV
jgi:hypothetical protein